MLIWGFESPEEWSKLLKLNNFLYIHAKKWKNWKWPLVCSNPNISASTWPKFKIKDSFEILRTSRIQNWPYFLNFVKIWWRYWQITNCGVFCGHGLLLDLLVLFQVTIHFTTNSNHCPSNLFYIKLQVIRTLMKVLFNPNDSILLSFLWQHLKISEFKILL